MNNSFEIKPLSNYDIEKIMKHLQKNDSFLGVFDQDSLPSLIYKYPSALILNTQTDKSKKIGHWVSIVFDKRGRGHYFDSFGEAPKYKHWRCFLSSNSRKGIWIYNKKQVQNFNTNSCGYFAIDFIVKRLKLNENVSDLTIVKHMSEINIYRKYVKFLKI